MENFLENQDKLIVQQNHGKFLSNILGDETVLMNMETGDYLGINNVGSDIWNLLKEPISVRELIEKVLENYDVAEVQCVAEVNDFLKKIEQHGMLLTNNDH